VKLEDNLENSIRTVKQWAKQEGHQFFTAGHLMLALMADVKTSNLLRACAPKKQLDELVNDLMELIKPDRRDPLDQVLSHPYSRLPYPEDTLEVQEIYGQVNLTLSTSKKECSGKDILIAIFDHGENSVLEWVRQAGITRDSILNAHKTIPEPLLLKKPEPEWSKDLMMAIRYASQSAKANYHKAILPEHLLQGLLIGDNDAKRIIVRLTSEEALSRLKDRLAKSIKRHAEVMNPALYKEPDYDDENFNRILEQAEIHAVEDGRLEITGKDAVWALLKLESEGELSPDTDAGKILKTFLGNEGTHRHFAYGAKMPFTEAQKRRDDLEQGNNKEEKNVVLPFFDDMKLQHPLREAIAGAFQNARVEKYEAVTPEDLLQQLLLIDDDARRVVQGAARIRKGDMENLALQLEALNRNRTDAKPGQDPVPSQELYDLMEAAVDEMKDAGRGGSYVAGRDVIAALFSQPESPAYKILHDQLKMTVEAVRAIKTGSSDSQKPVQDSNPDTPDEEEDSGSALTAYCVDLTQQARKGKIDPLIGRDKELGQVVQTLSRRTKNNAILVGEAGVGKTAIAEGLARKIVEKDVPAHMLEASVYSLDLGALVAGTKYRGDFEARLKNVVKELVAKKDKGETPILFIDEIHTLIGAGAVGGGTMDASNLLKPVLGKGFYCIGATTYAEYKIFEKNHALARRFNKIDVPEPSVAETVEILKGLKGEYERHHGVKYSNEALAAAAELSSRFVNDRHLPDKAIDVIDEAGAVQKTLPAAKAVAEIGTHEIEDVIAKMARIPAKNVSNDDREMLKTLDDDLKAVVFGQDKAIDALTKAIKMARSGLGNPEKPVGSFLFSGPTGVGKTEVARQLAQSLGVSLHRFDMSEYMEKHAVSRLIGAPPGYVGFDQGGLLTDAIINQPYSVVLLDEIEKAHPDIFNILLQVMDHGTLTDNNGRKANFRNVVIIMTTNAGAQSLSKSSMGFTKVDNATDEMADIKRMFTPEFRNRLDGIISFNRLEMEVNLRVVDKFLGDLTKQLHDKKVTPAFSRAARIWLAETGCDREMGARPLERHIKANIREQMADALLFGDLSDGGEVAIDFRDGALKFEFASAADLKSGKKKSPLLALANDNIPPSRKTDSKPGTPGVA
jgi:ATP-dependent Clp protease ATP-binding subunit ClpA